MASVDSVDMDSDNENGEDKDVDVSVDNELTGEKNICDNEGDDIAEV